MALEIWVQILLNFIRIYLKQKQICQWKHELKLKFLNTIETKSAFKIKFGEKFANNHIKNNAWNFKNRDKFKAQ